MNTLFHRDNVPDVSYDELVNNAAYKSAYLAGGCFWCMEPAIEALDGVIAVMSGYAGGEEDSPTYEQVASGATGHRESIRVFYDPKKIDYETILNTFWRQIDPTDDGGQFVDRGFQYTTAIFYEADEEERIAEKTKQALEQEEIYDKPIVTPIIPFTSFYPAEDYHQDYHKKNKVRYTFYRAGSGRDQYLEKVWGDAARH